MKLKNVEIFLQRKYDKTFKFTDNRNIDKPYTKLSKTLNQSKLALITSSGLYKKDEQAFDTQALLGDTSFRIIQKTDNLNTLEIAHTHYDHKFIRQDINTVYPIKHLETLVNENLLGSLADSHYSFCGFVLDTENLIEETAKGILQELKKNHVDIALLAPVWPVCNQSVGLIARFLEENGIPTVTLNMFKELGEYNQPPRIIFTDNEFGSPFGKPHDDEEQLSLVKKCIMKFQD